MHKIILDTDPGVDDAMAIAYAFCHPDIELLALTTVFGNISVEYATRNAQYVLESFGASDVAVARGAFVHGDDGLGNCYPHTEVALTPTSRHATIEPDDAADYINAAARAQPGEISLVAVGPLTNIALALARAPELPSLGECIAGGRGKLSERSACRRCRLRRRLASDCRRTRCHSSHHDRR